MRSGTSHRSCVVVNVTVVDAVDVAAAAAVAEVVANGVDGTAFVRGGTGVHRWC